MLLVLDPITHLYTVDGVVRPGVNEILQAEGIVDFSSIPAERLTAAQNLGKAVHVACELWDKNDLDMKSVDLAIVPYLEAYIKFKRDLHVDVIVNEVSIYSKTWGFCGTLDKIVYADNILTLLDIKTSTTMNHATTLQTAAYKILYEETVGKKVIKQRWGLQLKPDATYRIEPYLGKSDETIFTSLVVVHTFKTRLFKKGETNG